MFSNVLMHVVDPDEPSLDLFKESIYYDEDGYPVVIDCSNPVYCLICEHVDLCDAYDRVVNS